MDNDPDFNFGDAELNDKGKGQATDLQQKTAALSPELLVVSPMRRATTTGLLAFAPHIERKELPVLAIELTHERAGRHTCDKRLAKARLAELHPAVDYSAITTEEDPYWEDVRHRQSFLHHARRVREALEVLEKVAELAVFEHGVLQTFLRF